MATKVNPFRVLAWQYHEFLPPGRPPTNRAGIDAALTFLSENSTPPIGTVVGNIDGNGDVRLFLYGYETIVIGPAQQ